MRISDWSSDVCSSDLKVRSDKPAPKPYKLVDTHRLFRLVPPQRWQAVALSEGHDPSVAKKLKIEAGRQMLEKRSAEHTSELQSLMRSSYAVFCLTKKKQHTHYRVYTAEVAPPYNHYI